MGPSIRVHYRTKSRQLRGIRIRIRKLAPRKLVTLIKVLFANKNKQHQDIVIFLTLSSVPWGNKGYLFSPKTSYCPSLIRIVPYRDSFFWQNIWFASGVGIGRPGPARQFSARTGMGPLMFSPIGSGSARSSPFFECTFFAKIFISCHLKYLFINTNNFIWKSKNY